MSTFNAQGHVTWPLARVLRHGNINRSIQGLVRSASNASRYYEGRRRQAIYGFGLAGRSTGAVGALTQMLHAHFSPRITGCAWCTALRSGSPLSRWWL